MDLLRSHLHKVRIPEPTNRIHKDECCVSFDTPRSEGGLYVDMSSFLGFGREYVEWNFEKTGNPVYLHIMQRRKPEPDEADRPLKKPTLLAIGVEGGFGDQEPEYDDTFEIVILPDFISLPFPSVDLPEKVRLAVDKVLLAESADRKEQLAAWVADKKNISADAMDLQQLDNGVIVPPTGWKCSKCDKTENLWLNLTDGMILCGRKLWDGSGGNNHAIEHYEQTKYPLAVKLGTITADLEAADVFSYPEYDSVEDPLLAQHLSHFGIDFSSLQKTEMTTAEIELDATTNFDWNRIQESGKHAELLFGPGYTGLANLGNSCYMASIMQVMFSTHPFISRYFEKQSLKAAFATAPADPTVDLNMQMLDSYVYDYLLKRNLQNTAKAFLAESNVPSAPVSIDAPGGFLFEWWSVFWDIFIARTNEKHSDSAASYLESIKAQEQQQQSQHQIQMQQLLLQKHAQQHPQEQQQRRRQQKQQQRSENTDFTTSAQNGTVAADPPVRQNDTAASALSAKIYEDRMKITVQRDVSEEAFMKQRLTESIGPLLESNPTSMLKSPARSSLASGQIFHRSAGGVSGSLLQAQVRSQPLLGSTQDMKAETNVALNLRAAGADGSLFGAPGSNQAGNNLTLKGWPLTGLEHLRSGFLQHKSYMHQAQPLQHQLQFLTQQQQQQILLQVQAQQNITSPGDMDNRRLRMLFGSRNLVPGRDGQSNAFAEIVPSVGQSLQNMCLPTQRAETDMLMKKIAALQQQQQSNNPQQLLQHPLLSQQQESSNYLAGEQEKMGAGIVTVAFAGNEQVSKNRNGRKRKHPISSSGPANSSGTTNTAGASPSSTPSTPSAHSPGETISTPLQHQNASSCTALVVYGSEGAVPIGSPTNQLVDMDRYVEDGSMEDNLEPYVSHNGTNPRAAGSHCISSGKGYILREVSSAQASTSGVLCCHFSSDGKLIATGGHDKKVFLWNADNLKQKSMLEDHSLLITDVRFSPSTPCLATSSFDKTVRVWDAANLGYSIRTFTGHSASVMSLDFHPNKDDLISSCDGDNEIRFWSIKHGNVVRIFKGGSTQLRFQPRYGGYLATASDNVVSILDVETQTCVRRFESHTKGVDSVCWDPTGEYVVSVSEDTVKVWSLNDESFVNELNCNGRKFTSCTFHPTYPSLLIIGCYQSLELWDMSENRSMTIAAHDSLVSSLASSSSGLVASTSHDKYVKLWR